MTNHDRTDDLDQNDPATVAVPDVANTEDDEDPGWPWSFILLVVAGALYLIFRFAEVAINLAN
jgi:hypothetical protein